MEPLIIILYHIGDAKIALLVFYFIIDPSGVPLVTQKGGVYVLYWMPSMGL